MNRKESIETIVESLDGSEAVISSLGLISRELFENHDSENNFYMVGSMGLAPSIGLGIGLNSQDTQVVVIDGDGSVLMNLGSLATIGSYYPKNFIHIVLDNNAYGSCTEEPTFSKDVKLEEVAKSSGYSTIERVHNKEELYDAIQSCSYNGPNFILAEIERGGRRHIKRPLDLPYIAGRFKGFLLYQ